MVRKSEFPERNTECRCSVAKDFTIISHLGRAARMQLKVSNTMAHYTQPQSQNCLNMSKLLIFAIYMHGLWLIELTKYTAAMDRRAWLYICALNPIVSSDPD